MQRTYRYPSKRVCFLGNNARAGTAIVSTLLRHCRNILTTAAKRIDVRRTNTVRCAKRGIVRLPRARKGLLTSAIQRFVRAFETSTGGRRVMRPNVICVSRPARCNALCAGRRLLTLTRAYHRCSLPLCISKTHLTCTLTAPRGSVALTSLTTSYAIFCVNKAGYNTLVKRTIIVPRGKQVPRFFAAVGRRNTLLTGN